MMAQHQNKIPIWLDVDTGHDDAFALLLAAHHPRAHLIGVSTTHGNAPVHHTTTNTRAVLTAIGRPNITVISGAAAPLTRKASFAPSIHGETGLDGVALLPPPKQLSSADAHAADEPLAERIARIASLILAQPAGLVYMVATGPLTNFAMLLTAHPQVAEHIAGISLMGGAVGSNFTAAPMGTVADDPTATPRFGNWTPVAEFNICADPEAATAVFAAGQRRGVNTMVGLDCTHLCRGLPSVQEMILRRGGVRHEGSRLMLREMMHQVMTFFAGTYASHFSIRDGPPVHDPLAVWAVLEPERFEDGKGERYDVHVVIEGAGYDKEKDPLNRTGQTVLSAAETGSSSWRVPRGLDLEAFWDRIDTALTRAEEELVDAGQNPWER